MTHMKIFYDNITIKTQITKTSRPIWILPNHEASVEKWRLESMFLAIRIGNGNRIQFFNYDLI